MSLKLLQRCGPGLLFAGAAIGVSHLVQSTRAGANFGLSLIIPVILVLIVKFPAFSVGSLYTAHTGKSLVHAYKDQHPFYLWLFSVFAIIPYFVVLAAVTVVTAGLFLAVTELDQSIVLVSAILLALCTCLLSIGGFKVLDQCMKFIFVLMTVSTLVATSLAISSLDFSFSSFVPYTLFEPTTFIFLMALIGFMPAPVDISVTNSFWALEKKLKGEFNIDDAWFDFKLGYFVTGFLAICFIILGASLFYQNGVELSPSPIGFCKQIIDLYTNQLGEWSRPLVGVCALTVMFSTTLTVSDGFPRVVAGVIDEVKPTQLDGVHFKRYVTSMLVLNVGAVILLYYWLSTLRGMVDFATTLTALVSPLLAFLNHKVYFGKGSVIPREHRPVWLSTLSVVGVVFLSVLSAFYLYI